MGGENHAHMSCWSKQDSDGDQVTLLFVQTNKYHDYYFGWPSSPHFWVNQAQSSFPDLLHLEEQKPRFWWESYGRCRPVPTINFQVL